VEDGKIFLLSFYNLFARGKGIYTLALRSACDKEGYFMASFRRGAF